MGSQGYKNQGTWSVALHMGNDFGWYQVAKAHKRYKHPILSFRKQLMDSFGTTLTPDRVSLWNEEEELDIEALDEMIKEM